MRTILTKKQAAIAVVLIAALILLATIWPMKLYSRKITTQPGDIVEMTEVMDSLHDAGEYFYPRYDHIESMSFYFEAAGYTDYYYLQLMTIGRDGPYEVMHLLNPYPGDGWQKVKLDIDVVPDQMYILLITPRSELDKKQESHFRMGLTYYDEGADLPDDTTDYYVGFYHDTGIDHRAMAMEIVYSIPFGMKRMAASGAVVILLALAWIALVTFWFKKFPERNTLTTVRRVLRYTLTPVVVIAGLGAMICIFPLKLFDDRALDIAVYLFGTAFAAAAALYGLWHKDENTSVIRSKTMQTLQEIDHRHLVIIAAVAFIMRECSRYMNALSDMQHDISKSSIIILLSVIILMMGEVGETYNLATILTAVAGTAASLMYYKSRVESPDMPFFEEHNLILRYQLGSYVFAAIAFVCVLVVLLDKVIMNRNVRHKHGENAVKIAKIPAISMAVFFAGAIIMMTGRIWIPILAGMYIMIYIRYYFWDGSGSWLKDVSYGIILHFICMVIWSMMYRYYIAYLYNRFSMHFHTVTVTAYYLLIVASAVMILFLEALENTKGMKLAARLRVIWKECLLFGAAASYMAMSLTRAGIGAMAIMGIMTAVLMTAKKGSRVLGPVKALACMFLILVLTLPTFFTGQRCIAPAVGKPYRFDELEPYPSDIMYNVQLDNNWFMNVELFIRDFGDRIIGGEVGTKIYEIFNWDSQQSYRIISKNDNSTVPGMNYAGRTASLTGGFGYQSQMLIAEADEEDEEDYSEDREMIGGTEGSIDTGDYSNGRVELWKQYISEVEMKGHETMGVTLPSGEVAVHAHNVFLQMAYDCGIPVGILFLLFIGSSFISAFVYFLRNRELSLSLLPFAILFGFCTTGLVEWIFQFCNPYTTVLMMVMAPILMRKGSK